MISVFAGLLLASMKGCLLSIAARAISTSSRASSGVRHPQVTMSQSLRTEKLNVSPMNGVVRPAAIGLMVITGFLADLMILYTDSTSTCIRKPRQLKIWM